MATQTGIATSKVIILVLGAGLAGPTIFGKSNLSDIISRLKEAISGGHETGKAASDGSADTAAIQAQILRLAQEMKQLYGGRQITVMNGSTSSRNLTSYIVPLAVVGALGYCYMWWKGWTFSDIMYVTRKGMADAVSGFTKQLEQVSSAVAAAKRHLMQRMEKLNEKLDEQKEVTGAIILEVGEVRENLTRIGMDIESIQQFVEGLGTQIDAIEGKQDLTNAGIMYLYHFVQGLDQTQKPELSQVSMKPKLDLCPPTALGLIGFKELQYLEDALQTKGLPKPVAGEDLSAADNIQTPGGMIHRSFKCA